MYIRIPSGASQSASNISSIYERVYHPLVLFWQSLESRVPAVRKPNRFFLTENQFRNFPLNNFVWRFPSSIAHPERPLPNFVVIDENHLFSELIFKIAVIAFPNISVNKRRFAAAFNVMIADIKNRLALIALFRILAHFD